jgi:hypothetical protein
LNARRGTGVLEDYLVADLLITDKDAIEGVESGKLSELSAGYDAQYEQTAPGVGRQHTIRFNHLAFVDQGRCGSMCAVKDQKTVTKDRFSMKKQFLSKLKAAFSKVMDEAAEMMEESYDEAKECEHGKAMKDCKECMDKAKDEESEKEEKAKDESEEMISTDSEEEKEEKAKDESEKELEDGDEEEDEDEDENEPYRDAKTVTKDSFNKTVARAEILSPGIKVPTYDSANAKKTADSICSLKRRALTAAFADAKKKSI